jgi:glycosyltransferase involved in cell wall biosynthesis
MRYIFIGNYPPDQQQSMLRFDKLMESGFREMGYEATLWRPRVVFGHLAATTMSGFGKWLGYLDKYVLFLLMLRWRRLFEKDAHYHICDHSNSPYLAHLPAGRASITCHDVLAIRGAFGHADAYCQASRFGVILQRWILGNLSRARTLGASSLLTLQQLQALAPDRSAGLDWRVIPIALNGEFAPMTAAMAARHLDGTGLAVGEPYILHVGSGHPRKNRKLLLDMVAELGPRWSGKICFAGHAVDAALREQAERLGLAARVVEVVNPGHETLVALYSCCEAFIFPSYSEGFGWPPVEAQACGAPVIASKIEPMPEVSAKAAMYVAPDDAVGFAEAFLTLQDAAVRDSWVQAGFENARRYATGQMIEAYVKLIGGK